MAPVTRSSAHGAYKIPSSQRTDAGVKKSARRRNTKTVRRSLTQKWGSDSFDDGMSITQKNIQDSPLLRLPAEIRNMIWTYAMGGHEIIVRDHEGVAPVRSRYEQDKDALYHPAYDQSNIQLHKVCKQIHTEVAPLLYTLNTLCFYYLEPLDKWIKRRSPHQLRLVTSIRVPFNYFRLYSEGFRKDFREQFPNLERLALNEYAAWHAQRLDETSEQSEARLIQKVHEREGEDLLVEWYAWPSYGWGKRK